VTVSLRPQDVAVVTAEPPIGLAMLTEIARSDARYA
jgi:hypothetical protein